MDRKNDRVIMLAVGAVAGIALSLLFRPSEANAQIRISPVRQCVGTTYDTNGRLLYRCWNDGTMDYTMVDSVDAGTQTWHFRVWKPVQP